MIAVGSEGAVRDRALGGALRAFPRFREPGACVVSENFAALHHVAVGDKITIPGRTTPTIDLEVLGTVVDYSYNRGVVLVDYAWYSEEFADDQVDVFDVYLKPGADARRVQAELTKPGGWAAKQAVFVERRDELRDAVNSQLERIYHLAYAQEFVVGLVALLGVVSALFISVLQRRRELGLLRAVGASRGQILWSVLAEASLMGVVGAVLGVLIGLVLEWYTVRIMVFDEAGFVFPMMVPWMAGVAVLGGSVLTATLVGLWPAWRATRCASRKRSLMNDLPSGEQRGVSPPVQLSQARRSIRGSVRATANRRVWQIIRESGGEAELHFPVILPGVALLQCFQRHYALSIVPVPAHPSTLDALGRGLAHGLRRPAPNLPAQFQELRILDHLPTIRHVVQNLFRRLTVARSTQPALPLLELFA